MNDYAEQFCMKLRKTVDHYNECCEKGEDDLFGRDSAYLVSVTQAPFYIIEVKCTLAATDCGLRVDEYMHVSTRAETPSPASMPPGTRPADSRAREPPHTPAR